MRAQCRELAGGSVSIPSMSPTPPQVDPTVNASAADELLLKLTDPDRDIRQAAALSLGERADSTCALSLVERLWVEEDFFVRETITWAITRVKESALPAVLAGLRDDRSVEVRTQALHVLSKFADPETIDEVLPLADAPDESVARKARWALARIGDVRAVPYLVDLMGGPDGEEKNSLTNDLAAFGAEAVPALVSILESSEADLRRHAADVLCFIGHPDAEDAVDALGSTAQDADSLVAVSALMALDELHTEQARQYVEDARSASDPRVRAVADRLATRRRSRRPRRSTSRPSS
ncbi:PBS lyase HEAT-like repeat [Kocuria rosea]|nr:PBS lyase HEAT-like repeat [Kocuria rosea]STX07551.1 PBS lyase HEAT-like repeat [Kocuria rosea]VEH41716.1 PBS lyase HEAT-like repeat [Kocuria rosea]